MDMLSNRAKAFSYIRFSAASQLQGDSLRRQTRAARDYAERNGLDLDDSLNLRDLGVSAFKGANAAVGALGAFVKVVQAGKVQPGSFLLVEDIDRLSRQNPWDALPVVQQIINSGITLVTLKDEQVYSPEAVRANPFLLMQCILVMTRGHEESAMKSRRLRAVWKSKKEKAANGTHVMTKLCPAWLRVNENKFEVIPDRAEIVRRIFRMALAGHGYVAIARQFNVEKVPPFGKSDGWHHSYVRRILRNEAVIGRYQPMKRAESGEQKRVPDGDPIENYFPAVIKESDFYRVKHNAPGVSAKRNGMTPQNILRGLVRCAKCGGKAIYLNKGKPYRLRHLPSVPDQTWLHCDNARRKKSCEAKAVRYDTVLESVLDQVKHFREIEPDDSEIAARNAELDALTAQISETQVGIETAVDALLRVPSPALEKRLGDLESTLTNLKARREELNEKVIAREDRRSFDGVVFDTFLDTSPRLPTSKTSAQDLTAHIAVELRRMVERVEVEKGEPVRVVPRKD